VKEKRGTGETLPGGQRQAKSPGIRPKAENLGSQEGVREARSTQSAGEPRTGGRRLASVTSVMKVSAREGPDKNGDNNPREKVRELQRGLYVRAKRKRTRRSHALYELIYRSDVLWEAWRRVRANGGAAGVDRQTLAEIQRSGVKKFLEDIRERLSAGRYRPSPVRRRYIRKADGKKQRPLGIPTIRDRVVQMATKIVIEPIFEADFLPCSYGFRPKKSTTQAMEAIREAGNQGYNFVVDADIQSYFDSIDQTKLMEKVGARISDRQVLKLIRKWLSAGVMEEGAVKCVERGTPQGGVISPLLANIYLHGLDSYWERECGHLGKLVRYADDMVAMCHSETQAKEALRRIGEELGRMGLKLHPEKTKLVDIRRGREGFKFLGWVVRKRRSIQRNPKAHYVQRWPCTEAVKRVCRKVHEMTQVRGNGAKSVEEVIARINPVIRGWGNYFRTGNADRKFTVVDDYVRGRILRWQWKRGGQRRGMRLDQWPAERLHGMGLHRLRGTVAYPSKAAPRRPSVSCVRETRTHSLKGGFGIGFN